MKQALSFDDVLLLPQYSDIESRSEVSLESSLGPGLDFSLPIISAPMDTITEWEMLREMSKCGGSGILHRYMSAHKQAQQLTEAAANSGSGPMGVALGANEPVAVRAESLLGSGASYVCIDVAHAHHIMVKRAIQRLRGKFGSDIHIMVGNVATLEAFNALSDWGADSIKVGIGGGSICSTRLKTGHGMPTFESILQCAQSDRPAKLIADGGIRKSGDIVKALAAGADFVMLGSLLAGTNETPGEVICANGAYKKVYRGMASREAQQDWRGSVSSDEGVSHMVYLEGPVREVLNDLATGVRSGLSYSGARSIPELQAKAKFVMQTSAGVIEGTTHIKEK